MLPMVVVNSPELAESILGSPIWPITFVVGFVLIGLLSLVCGVLLALRVVRPGFLTGWSAAGNLCMAALIAVLWLQPLFVGRMRDSSLPASSFRWLAAIPLCLFIASLILQGRGFFKHRKARHAD
jgi:uncharacterized membrane protein